MKISDESWFSMRKEAPHFQDPMSMLKGFLSTMVAVALASTPVAGQVIATASQTTPQPAPATTVPVSCAAVPERHHFDFWIGEWDVTTGAKKDGSKGGNSVIQSVSGGCALLENWTSIQGGQGKSLNAYNPLVHEWQQYWIGQDGNVTEFRTSHFDGTSLSFLTDDGPGPNLIGRLTFTPMATDLVRQHYESSGDAGKTWTTVYDLYYHRKGR
jgi:hypothetical protein